MIVIPAQASELEALANGLNSAERPLRIDVT